jgi:hypothetical protein
MPLRTAMLPGRPTLSLRQTWYCLCREIHVAHEKLADIEKQLKLLDAPAVSSSPPPTPPGYVLDVTGPGGPMVYMTKKK